ncbi:MAG: T9SS type A sorting domain-containing protein [Bacteroidaceae bacterium]|nr:T9SS type A sorting domain-containing protein [Bacteroidaceae bacterium]
MKYNTSHIFTSIALSFLSFVAVPAMADTTTSIEGMEYAIIEPSQKEVTLSFVHNTLKISNAEGKILKIYDVTGKLVLNEKIESDSVNISLSDLTKSIYIVKVENKTLKIAVK